MPGASRSSGLAADQASRGLLSSVLQERSSLEVVRFHTWNGRTWGLRTRRRGARLCPGDPNQLKRATSFLGAEEARSMGILLPGGFTKETMFRPMRIFLPGKPLHGIEAVDFRRPIGRHPSAFASTRRSRVRLDDRELPHASSSTAIVHNCHGLTSCRGILQ